MTGNRIYSSRFGWNWSDIFSFRGQKNYAKIRRKMSRIANKANRQEYKRIIYNSIEGL